MKTYHSYEEASQDYLALFGQLLEVPDEAVAAPRRGAADLPAETLIDRADQIADVSAGMLPFSLGYLESPDFTLRQGASGHLIAQAAAELQLANELLHIVEGERDAPQMPATRSTRGRALKEAVTALELTMSIPISQGLASAELTSRAPRPMPATLADAKKSLQTTAIISAGSITQQVCEFGGDLAWDLVFKTEWMVVLNGAALLRKDIAKKLDDVKEGSNALITRAVNTASKTLLNVYDKIMALLGKDDEDKARQKIKEWLEKIKEQEEIDLFEKVVGNLYKVEGFKQDLEGWLAKTSADVKKIHEAAGQVGSIADQFIVLVGRVKLLEDVIGFAKVVKIPQVLLVATGIQIALLAVLVYAGHDYIGYKGLPFPNITKGVAEVIQENLMIKA